jgi:hypothetical protein
MLLSLLQTVTLYCGQLRAPESATQQYSKHGVVALAAKTCAIKYREQPLSLIGGQPVPEANTAFFRAFHASDSGGQIRAK